MAITPDPPLQASDANYTPTNLTVQAKSAWKENICVLAGDRIEKAQFILTPDAAHGGNLQPDGTVGFGAGFMPHWRYTPKYAKKQDLNEQGFWQRQTGGRGGASQILRAVNGNLEPPQPIIRVDLADLYCPWDGEISVEGGMGATGSPSGTQLVIAYIWDQTNRLRRGSADPQEHYYSGRVPADTRIKYQHKLTFWTPFSVDTSPLPIQIPNFATKVWTPSSQLLTLDNGPGTYAVTERTQGENLALPTSGFSRVTAVANSVPCIIFEIIF